MIKALIAKLAGASGLTWLGMLPWALLAFAGAVAGAGAYGWHEGSKVTTAKYEAEKSNAAALSAAAAVKEISHIAQITSNILTVARDYLSELNLSRERRKQIVAKVTADAKANIPSAWIVPAATRELRKQQVDQSAAIAAQDRPM